MRAVIELYRDPLFQHEFRRRERWRSVRLLAACALVYVICFIAARGSQPLAGSAGAGYTADFNYSTWLLGGFALLTFPAHWLVPPAVLLLIRSRYELRTLSVMLCTGSDAIRSFRAQVAGSIAPLALGALPLAAGLVPLAGAPVRYPLLWAAGLLGAALWCALMTAVSLWCGVTARNPGTARVCAYLLGTVLFPLMICGLSASVGLGCSAGHPPSRPVFWTAAGLTWGFLVLGLSATFWDLACSRALPRRPRGLWLESEEPALET